jgi:hypothetical protein
MQRFLTRHFFDRFFDKDSTSHGSDPKTSVIQTASMLAVPGLMFTFWLRFSPYFFVSYSMIVVGFVMIFKWDSLFPDRRDYLILGSLPIRYRDLFVAKVKALSLFIAIFALSANFFATLMVPAGSGRAVGAVFVAHVAGVFGGALFMALGFASLQGTLIAILPDRIFRRVSPVIQTVSIGVLLTILLIYPLIQASIAPLAENSSGSMHYFPMFWFLGLYMVLLPGAPPNPIFTALALKAVYGLLIGGALFLLTYAIAYKRHARSILDAIEAGPAKHSGWRFRVGQRVGRTLLNHPVQRACFRFIGAVLSRSTKHQVFLSVYLAVGLSLGLSSLFVINPTAGFPFSISKDGMLALPLILSFFVVSGLRATFNIPYELPANWIFQTTDTHDSRQHVNATRKWVAVSGVLPLALCVSAIEFAYWSWMDAAFHLVFEGIVSLALLEILFINFRKVPFTCSYYPGKRNLAIVAGVYLFGFTAYSSSMVAIENWIRMSPARAFAFAIAGIAGLVALAAVRRRPSRLVYEEHSDAELLGLGLN